MLPIHAATVRLFIHVLAATVWVGGQITLGGLVPVVRKLGPEATRSVARQFNRLASVSAACERAMHNQDAPDH